MSMEEKDQEDVMQRLLELGGDKKFLTFDDLNRELPDNIVSPDDIEDVLQKLEGSNILVTDSDERVIEVSSVVAVAPEDSDDEFDEDIELDLSAGCQLVGRFRTWGVMWGFPPGAAARRAASQARTFSSGASRGAPRRPRGRRPRSPRPAP